MNNLSIDEISVNKGLAQIRTGKLFKVTSVDTEAKKVTVCSLDGEEKVLSRATLERWYRELTAQEVVEFGKELIHAGESVQEQDSSDESDNAKANETATFANRQTPSNSDETTSESICDGASRETNEAVLQGTAPEPESRADNAPATEETGDSEIIKSPVTPSNAGKDKEKAREKRPPKMADAALEKVRRTIIDTVLADSPSIQLKHLSAYDVLKEKRNFAEITFGNSRFTVSVVSDSLKPEQLQDVRVDPANFGWSIDANFTVFSEEEIDEAVEMIRQSRAYCLANPTNIRKKPKTKKK